MPTTEQPVVKSKKSVILGYFSKEEQELIRNVLAYKKNRKLYHVALNRMRKTRVKTVTLIKRTSVGVMLRDNMVKEITVPMIPRLDESLVVSPDIRKGIMLALEFYVVMKKCSAPDLPLNTEDKKKRRLVVYSISAMKAMERLLNSPLVPVNTDLPYHKENSVKREERVGDAHSGRKSLWSNLSEETIW